MSNNNDVYAIELAKTELREGFNLGDIERVLSVFAAGFTDMSAGQPSFFGTEAHEAMRLRLTNLFAAYRVKMLIQIIDVQVYGSFATDLGWYKLWLTPKNEGQTRYAKFRYTDWWAKTAEGLWQITLMISSRELAPRMTPLNEVEVMNSLTDLVEV